jgi:hypothetical protein
MMRPGLRMLRAVVALPALALPAVTAAQDIAGIREIAPPTFAPPFILSGVLVLLLAGLIFLAYKRRQLIQPPTMAVQSADTAAVLAQLAESMRLGQCPNDQAIIKLDALLRDEFEGRAAVPACRLTTQELNDMARRCDWLDADAQSRLSRLLTLCDRVKFSAFQPDHEDVASAMETVRILLDRIPP